MSKPDHAILAAVMSAKTIADLLGEQPTVANVRKLRVQIHPDRFDGDDTAWRKLDELLAVHESASPSMTAKVPPVFEPLELRAGKRTYRLTSRLHAGAVADIYATEHDGIAAVAKVAGDPRDNDLLVAEAAALRVVSPSPKPERLEHLLPRLLDTFELRSGAARRRVNIISRACSLGSGLPVERGGAPAYVTVADVMRAYPAPGGLDFRDAAWIARRMLGALGLAHSRGYVHAGVLPHHVMVHPTEHDALLVDWCYAVPAGSKGRALVKGCEASYPPELRAGKPVGPQADVYMFGVCFARLLGAAVEPGHDLAYPRGVPDEIRRFVAACLIGNPARRPADAWALHDDLGDVMRALVGAPKFRTLAMPSAPTTSSASA